MDPPEVLGLDPKGKGRESLEPKYIPFEYVGPDAHKAQYKGRSFRLREDKGTEEVVCGLGFRVTCYKQLQSHISYL